MTLSEAIDAVARKFVYKADRLPLYDSWRVMREKNGMLHGDCDDFAVTAFWLLSGRHLGRFLLHALLTHSYRFHYTTSKSGVPHLVASYEGQFFDNWSRKALPKDEFFRTTGHRPRFVIPGPLVGVYLFLGLIFK
jgi:hypothetical protein